MPKSKRDEDKKRNQPERKADSAGRRRRAKKKAKTEAPKEEEVKVTDKRASRQGLGLDAEEPERAAAEAADTAEAPEAPPQPEQREEPAKPEPEPPAETPEEVAPEEAAEEEAVPREPVSVYDALRWCMGIMTQQAWQHLGLRADPATGTAKEDLEQAEIAIDTLGFMYQRVLRDAQDDEKRALETELANLRLNFARIHSSRE